MLNYWDAIVLGLVQGITELLPISSSGHLVMMQHLFGLKSTLAFALFAHLGTLAAVLVYYRREVANMAISPLYPSRTKGARRTLFLIIIASLPTAAIGLGFQIFLKNTFDDPAAVGLFWLVTAALLFTASRLREGFEVAERMSISDVLLIGLFQGFAILPGISRTGATLAGGMICSLRPREAANFSMLLFIPAVLGATVFEFRDVHFVGGSQWQVYMTGAIAAAVSGYLAIWALLKLMHRRVILPFAWYCVIASIVAMFSIK